MEGLEEEDKLEILGNLLESWANGGDRDEPGDVEKEGQNNDWGNMCEDDQLGAPCGCSFLGITN